MAAYLRRVGLDETAVAGPPDLALLTGLQAAHAATVPFENVEIQRGSSIRLDLPALCEKIVARRRGGYCFEQNGLFAAVLERVGFQVTRLIGRVRMGRPPEAPPPGRTHQISEVTIGSERYLVDVGFGSHSPLAPIPMIDGASVQQHAWAYELRAAGAEYTLRTRQPEGWATMYTFTREPQCAADFEVANHYTSTYPGSSFVQRLTLQRATPTERHTFRGLEYEVMTADGRVRRTIGSAAELIDLAARVFGLTLPADMRMPAFV